MSDPERVIARIGLDDTDRPEGGCTTYDLNELSRLLIQNIDSAQEVERRLVRLWPFAERRTRAMPHYASYYQSPLKMWGYSMKHLTIGFLSRIIQKSRTHQGRPLLPVWEAPQSHGTGIQPGVTCLSLKGYHPSKHPIIE